MTITNIYSKYPKSFISLSAGIATASMLANGIIFYTNNVNNFDDEKDEYRTPQSFMICRQSVVNFLVSTLSLGLSSIAFIAHLARASKPLTAMLATASTVLCLGANVIFRFIFGMEDITTEVTLTTNIIEQALNTATNNINEDTDYSNNITDYLIKSFEEAYNDEAFSALTTDKLTFLLVINVSINENKSFAYKCSVSYRLENDREDRIDPVASGYLDCVNNRARLFNPIALDLRSDFNTKDFNYSC